ncbi:MAG: glycosyltransferase [Bacteroidales bacterium]|nr:glycosyltransferase [Bacteroidales bacterium]
MKLSVIIVNYNVKFFIEQCLISVNEALKGIDAEVFVVDNNSVDGSCDLIKNKFQWVKLIENKTNTGFSYANNQAIRVSSGEYVLLLNPDTVVQETTFSKLLDFMDLHQEAGGAGVKMIDGKGRFLPESKRGIPTPMVAFYKMFGISSLFKKSKRFNKYHLGYLDQNQTNQVEILSGAFMLMRKKVLDEIGLLDEDYFMYGEDIDLSYRIIKADYKNYYFADTTIIHYKGESTKKGSVNYVLIFYKAMIIFAKKQLSHKHSKILSFLINIAIFIRASLSILNRIIKATILPLLDLIIIYSGFGLLALIWEQYRYSDLHYYPKTYFTMVIPIYTIIWLLLIFFNGGYEKPIKLKNAIKGVILGGIILLLAYALSNEHFRYSRALLLFGTLWSLIAVCSNRLLMHLSGIETFKINFKKSKRIILAGEKEEIVRIEKLLANTGLQTNIIGYVGIDNDLQKGYYLGTIDQLPEIIKIHKINEIIFCMKNISADTIISNMLGFSDIAVDFKIAPPETISIIGSNSINTAGELYTLELNSIGKKYNINKKRLFDIGFSALLVLSTPILILFYKNKLNFIKNCFSVLFGKKTWISYHDNFDIKEYNLPTLKKGILNPHHNTTFDKEIMAKNNIIYAKDYSFFNDLQIIIKQIAKLDN